MMKILFMTCLMILLTGCSWFSSGAPESAADWYAERIAVPRTERQLAVGELVLVLAESPENQREIEIIQRVLQDKNIHLRVVTLARRDALPAMVRSGRADLMAGAFTPEEIRSLRLLPVLPYPGRDGRSRYCFAVRRSDYILENLLGAVPDESSGRKETNR